MSSCKGLRERLRNGESIICAEGYMRELERRGVVRLGTNTPEVVLSNPQMVRHLHEEFVHAGSDVVQAFTCYGHHSKMASVDMVDEVEKLNLTALKMAREVADRTDTLMAGNICNTVTFDPNDKTSIENTRAMFKEQVEWAVQCGADYMIGETFSDFAEAKLALETIQRYGNGMPSVITMAIYVPDRTTDDVPVCEALRSLEELGADVVGLNCARGPQTMLPLLQQARKVCKGPLAAVPIGYRTNEQYKSFQSLVDPLTGERTNPINMECVQCSRSDIRAFAQQARDLGIQYIGLCCGTSSACLREIAHVYGRKPPASFYSPKLGSTMFHQIDPAPHVKKIRAFMKGDTWSP